MTCPYCQHDRIVYVHGHGQCARCGVNIEPCCDGGVCEVAAVDPGRVIEEAGADSERCER